MKRLDTIFPYPTPKIARIKDSKLGLLRYALMLFIAIYVIGYQIMWRGNHLETKNIAGVSQLALETPTRNNCDPINVECMQNLTSMAKLPYCAQSPEAESVKLPCQYWDAEQLGQVTDQQGLLIPTHISTFYQTTGCTPTAANNWTCEGWLYDFLDKKGEVQKKRGQASPINDIFVADIERYTLMIDHSVRSALGARSYASDMLGYWLDCNQENQSDAGCVPRPISCGHASCLGKAYSLNDMRTTESKPTFRGDRRSLSLSGQSSVARPKRRKKPESSKKIAPAEADEIESEPVESDAHSVDDIRYVPARVEHLESLGVVSLAQGDLFTIGQMLKAANVSLDRRRHNMPAWVGGSYRSSGFVLVIRIHYSNIESWLGLKVLPWNSLGPTMHYTYRITKHASADDFMLRQVQQNGPFNNSRTVTEYHGIRVLVEQSGSVAVWDNIQLLLILTTTLALMAVATCITDSVALYCMPQSDEYWAIKYERPRTRKKEPMPPLSMKASEPKPDEEAVEEAPEEEEDPEAVDDSVMRYSSITM